MEIAISIISFIIGYFAQKLFDMIFNKISIHNQYKKNKKSILKLSESHSSSNETNVMVLASGLPYYDRNDLFFENTEKELYFAFPQELRSKLSTSSGDFRVQDVLFNKITLPGYSDEEVYNAIEEARISIAEGFVNRKDGLYFNGMKYGILYADGFSRTSDDIEKPLYTCKLFRTDHFTHRVISEALKSLNVSPSIFTLQNLNEQLNWIRTSIGLSIIIILKQTNQILMTRRSRLSSYSEGKSWIYISVTETFTETDYDRYKMMPDILLCVKRGILEELGINSNLYDESKIKFYDSFFETHFYQDGIVVSVEIDDKISFEYIKNLNAKDKQLEVESLFLIDNNKKAINDFIAKNKEEMRSQTIFALKSYIAR